MLTWKKLASQTKNKKSGMDNQTRWLAWCEHVKDVSVRFLTPASNVPNAETKSNFCLHAIRIAHMSNVKCVSVINLGRLTHGSTRLNGVFFQWLLTRTMLCFKQEAFVLVICYSGGILQIDNEAEKALLNKCQVWATHVKSVFLCRASFCLGFVFSHEITNDVDVGVFFCKKHDVTPRIGGGRELNVKMWKYNNGEFICVHRSPNVVHALLQNVQSRIELHCDVRKTVVQRSLVKFQNADIWSTLPPMLIDCSPFASICHDTLCNRLIVVIDASIQAFDFLKQQWTWLPDMHCARKYHCTVILNDSCYVLGGIEFTTNTMPTQTVEKMNLIENVWKLVTPMQTPRFKFAAVVYSQKIYVFGGLISSKGELTDKVEVFDPVSRSWISLTNMPYLNACHQAVVTKDVILLLGGINAKPNSCCLYFPHSDTWQQLSTGQFINTKEKLVFMN